MVTDFLTPVRWLYRGILLLLVAVFTTVPTVLCVNRFGAAIPVGQRALDEFMLNWWTGLVARVLGIRISRQGTIAPPPVLVVANHISWLDIIVLHSSAAMGFVSKAEIARWPLIGFLARVSATVFHERGSHDSANSVTQAMVTRLAEGKRVAIFPEGGIRPGAGIKIFHARLFRTAIEAACPVQPVMIRYTRKGRHDEDLTFRPGERFVPNLIRILGRPSCRCELVFLEPFDTAGTARKALAARAQSMVTESYESAIE